MLIGYLVEREQTVIELLGVFGEILWPWVPIFIWLFAIYESYLIYHNKYVDLLHKPKSVTIDYLDSINLQISNFLVSLQSKFTVTSGGTKYVDKINGLASKYNSILNDKVGEVSSNFFNYIGAEHGRESENGSRVIFAALLFLLIYLVYWLPSITDFTKLLQVSNFLVTLSIFLLLAFH